VPGEAPPSRLPRPPSLATEYQLGWRPKAPQRPLKGLKALAWAPVLAPTPRPGRRTEKLPPRYSLTGSRGPVHKLRIPFQASKAPSPAAECQLGGRPQAPKWPPKVLIGLAWAPILAPTLRPGRRAEKLPPRHSLTSSWGPVHKLRKPLQAPKTPSPAAECQLDGVPRPAKGPPRAL
jgi:hypothetical protein